MRRGKRNKEREKGKEINGGTQNEKEMEMYFCNYYAIIMYYLATPSFRRQWAQFWALKITVIVF